MNLGAIDIGSNAARVLIMNVEQGKDGIEFNKLKLLRYPIRLGVDAFLNGSISEEKSKKMIQMCSVFKGLMELYDVQDYIAYATSAMRSSENGKHLKKLVKKETGIDIEIIDGNTEATILYQTHLQNALREDRNYIYADVGGGSTEVSIFKQAKLVKSMSFNTGTIRMLHNLTGDNELKEISAWVKKYCKEDNFFGIGSGGNINTLFSMIKVKRRKPISINDINSKLKEFQQYTVKELMNEYSFKADRADVIIPALKIYKTVYESAGVEHIYVPKIGLADGMIQLLSQKHFIQ